MCVTSRSRLLLSSAIAAVSVGLATPAAAPAVPPFLFLQLSDPQFGMFTGDKDFARETVNFEKAVAHVNRLRPDFVIITGDLVNKPGDAAQMAEYDRIRATIDAAIPVHELPGNHDVENAPTPAALAAYRARYGPDRYVFRHKSLRGLVLNSSLIHSPAEAREDAAAQEAWLRTQLAERPAEDERHLVVFQHHPWFLGAADEDDDYFNIPRIRRRPLLALLAEAGVRTLISGHYHRNAIARDAGFDSIVTGAVGMPLGSARSGLRAFRVADDAITHRFFELDAVPATLDVRVGF